VTAPAAAAPASHDVPLLPGLRTSAAWLAVGVATALGTLGLGSAVGIVLLAVGVAGWLLLWRRAPLGAPLAVIALGAVPAVVLSVAAATNAGCPDGAKAHLHAGELGKAQAVPCDQVVASYVSMAVFFGMVAIGGVIWLFARRNGARHDAAELADA
jgi:hypothetical protein